MSIGSILGGLVRTRFASILLLLVAALVLFGFSADNFMTVDNLRAILSGAAVIWVVALGTTFVMILGNFDLSVGSALTLSGVLFGLLAGVVGLPVWLALILTLVIGALLGGGLNGVLIGRYGVSFLVVTLGTSWLFLGLVNLVSDTKTVSLDDPLLVAIGFGQVAGIPVNVLIMIVTFASAYYVLNRTLFGRDIYAVGGSPQAARLSGIRVTRTIIAVYAISAVAAAAGGVLQAARISAASPLVGQSVLFDAVAAVLLGGTSFRGGSGSVTGTAIGVIFLATLSNGLGFLGVESFWQQIITGVIVVIAGIVGIAGRLHRGGFALRRPGKSPSPTGGTQ